MAQNPTVFQKKVWKILQQIPAGKLTTYSGIAKALGNKNAARAVGNACNNNPFAPAVPCHRVVKSNSQIGGYAHGIKKKIALLKKEGVAVRRGKIVGFKEKLFRFWPQKAF